MQEVLRNDTDLSNEKGNKTGSFRKEDKDVLNPEAASFKGA